MTKKVLLLAALLTTTTAVTAFADDYPINYDKSTDVTYVGRSLNSVSVDGISVDVPDNTKLYNNVTDEKLTVRAGQVVTPSVSFSGLWMNAYVYIDYDGNKNFDVQEPNTDGTLNEDNELVSYSYYVIGGVRKNSAGETLANGNNISLPTFVVPASLAPGTYKMRFKVDWCSIDPGGSTVSGNDIVKYYKNDSQYSIRLLDNEGNPVGANVSATFNINGVFYTRYSNASGHVKLNINLAPGNYVITAEYNGVKASNYINVLPTLEAKDLSMKYRDGSKFEVKVLDGTGDALTNANVNLNINGVLYTRISDDEGIARLNINLMPGQYIITSSYNTLNISNKITISS